MPKKAWIVAVDMGYGHQRAAYPLRLLAPGGSVVNAAHYSGIPHKDRRLWRQGQEIYSFMSRFKSVPVVGEVAWDLYDQIQEIPPFYPKRDLSKPTMQVKSTYGLIRKKQWGAHFIQHLAKGHPLSSVSRRQGAGFIKKFSKQPLPFITTFFIPAFQAEEFNYPGDIYLVVCDADISRAWAPLVPARSRIRYLAPTQRVVERLQLYGVPHDHITLTGFPLPQENYGHQGAVVKADLAARLVNLDPLGVYRKKYSRTIRAQIGALPKKSSHPFTIMFAVGGVGAQRELGLEILEGFRHELSDKKMKLILIAGIHNDVSRYFRAGIMQQGLRRELEEGRIEIIYAGSKQEYFKRFNAALRTTDILWTKPSELVFYAGLGIPLILSDPIGSQEFFNRRWIREVGAATKQLDPKFASEWVSDLLEEGWFAEAAMQGYLDVERGGTVAIEKLVVGK